MTSDAPRHLHVAAIVADGVRSGLQLAASVLVIAIVQGGTPGLAAAMAVGGIALGSVLSWIQWRARTYWLDDIALHYRSGVFTPDEKVVPRARVQSVDTVSGLIQRLFGVVELRVQVPGASDSDEIVLRAVTHEEAARLRRGLGQPAPAEPDVRIRLGRRGLLLTALTSPQISVAVSAVAGVAALFDNVVDVERDGEGLLSRLDSAQAILVAAAVVLAAGYLLSFLAAIVVFAGFEVERDAQVLRIRRGLLERRAQSMPLERVDGVVIVEGLARGPLGLAALRLETAAHGGEKAVARTLLPLVRRSEAPAVIARLVPGLAIDPGELERPPRRALRRFVLAPALAGAVLGAAPVVAWESSAWPALPALALLGALAGVRNFRGAGVRLAGNVVVVREVRVTRRTLLVRRHRLQEHALLRTALQERAALADLRVTVGSGASGRARHLEAAAAESAFTALRRQARTPDRRHAPASGAP
jgi:putative membrane protein